VAIAIIVWLMRRFILLANEITHVLSRLSKIMRIGKD
jgi:hypothetical protein